MLDLAYQVSGSKFGFSYFPSVFFSVFLVLLFEYLVMSWGVGVDTLVVHVTEPSHISSLPLSVHTHTHTHLGEKLICLVLIHGLIIPTTWAIVFLF